VSELSHEARTLLAEARLGGADDPSAEDRARMRAKVAAALALTTMGGAAASVALPKTAAAQLASASLSAKIVVASLVVATGGATVVGLRAGDEARERPRVVATAPRLVPPATGAPEPDPSSELDIGAGSDAELDLVADTVLRVRAREALKTPARRADTESRAEPAPPPSLKAELALIAAAQEALRAGRERLALERAGEHAARFPKGALVQERLGIAAIAACELGQRDRGLSALRTHARRAPSSPLLVRARAACREPDAE
jgi:hypothetical protein